MKECDMENDSSKNGAQEDSLLVVLVTAPDQDTAKKIARSLVEEKLVACVNIVAGVSSIYRWGGKTEDAAEVLMVVKTTRRKFGALASRVKELHPYTTPEIIALAAADVEPLYFDWVLESVRE